MNYRREYIKKLMNVESEEAYRIVEDIKYYTEGETDALRRYQQGKHKNEEIDIDASYHRTFKDVDKNIEDFIAASPKWAKASYRGIGMTREMLQMLKIGDEIDMRGTSSWSIDKSVAEKFAANAKKEMSVIFIEKNGQSHGTSITALSAYHSEREILCSKNARWKITNITPKDETTIEITVESL